jgi:deoxyribonuclease V
VRALPLRPDVLLVNSTGLDHPRGAGLAIHLGAVLGLPTIGVTERRLTGGEEGVARLLITRVRARPLVVHPGWRTDLDTAVQVVLRLCLLARTPEPLREARRLARTARAASQRPGLNSLTIPADIGNPTRPLQVGVKWHSGRMP